MSEYEQGRREGAADREYYIREFGEAAGSVALGPGQEWDAHARGYRDGYLDQEADRR